ncbi:MAG: hypothetical protein ACLQBJ_19460 [Bryobacteraceae bacterium]
MRHLDHQLAAAVGALRAIDLRLDPAGDDLERPYVVVVVGMQIAPEA